MARSIRPIAVVVLVASMGLAGCDGSYPEQSGTPEGESTAATAPPRTNAPANTGRAASTTRALLGDGRHAVYLKAVDANRRTITFDLIQFLIGEAAAKAAAEDGKESPPPNDYYIRNVNPKLRTLPVRADAPITVNVLAAEFTDSATKNHRVTLTKLAIWFPRTGLSPFWIRVEDGEVVEIAEQYIP
jgi:hypothetical protein